jgi:hypothetical protein
MLDPAAIDAGLIFSFFGPRGAIWIRLVVRFRLDVLLAFFLTFPDTVAAFAFAVARRVSCRHFFHDIVLLIQDWLFKVCIVASDNVKCKLGIIFNKSS